MKTIGTIAILSCIFATQANADLNVAGRQTVVHQTQTIVPVDINSQTVQCLSADYSGPVLKILIPSLARLTLLNHQNSGAGQPCVTTNESCLAVGGHPGASPDDVILGRPGRENAVITVREIRAEEIDQTVGVCHVNLIEQVGTTIRGKNFVHERIAQLTDRPISDCQ